MERVLRKVVVLAGSKSDLRQGTRGLNELRRASMREEIDFRLVRVCSAHRNPVRLHAIIQWLINERIDWVIAGAGKSNHLTGILDALLRNQYHDTHTVVAGVAFTGKTLKDTQEAIRSITGVPGFQGIFDEKRHVGSEGFYNAVMDVLMQEKPVITLAAPKPGEDFTIEAAYANARYSDIPEKGQYNDLIEDLEAAGLFHEYTGKVRETFSYDAHPDLLYMYHTDRISIFDIVLNERIPEKGALLTAVTVGFLTSTLQEIPNHLVAYGKFIDKYLPEALHGDRNLHEHMIVVKKTKPLKVEAICRGYLTGSGLKDYNENGGVVCGIQLPPGLTDGSQLPEPIFTPSTKAELGEHDENISFAEACQIIGEEHAEKVRELTLKAYGLVHAEMLEKGIILADTKLEFGIDKDGNLILIDETFTPDSSRYWPVDGREEAMRSGETPPSFDKQPVRIAGLAGGVKKDPTWVPSAELIEQTTANYLHIASLKFGKSLEEFQRDTMGIRN